MNARIAARFAAFAATAAAARAQAPIYTAEGQFLDQIGRALAFAGDVDGDGVADFAVGAPYADVNGARVGVATIHSGATGGELNVMTGEEDGDEFGRALAAVADIDGDGRSELLVGAPAALGKRGVALVIGSASGAPLRKHTGAAAHDFFGASVANVGDVDLDGVSDYAVGAPSADVGGFVDNGSAHVFSGATGVELASWWRPASNAQFGAAVAGAGDVDGDGRADVLVGAPTISANGVSSCGAAFLYTSLAGQTLAFAGSEPWEHTGLALASLGDIDGDKKAEFAVGAPYFNGVGSQRGRVRVYGDSGLRYEIAGQDGWRLGAALALLGDFSGDKKCDFAIGAPGYAAGGVEVGAARIHACVNGGIVTTLAGEHADGAFGAALAGGADLNGDAFGELLVGAPMTDAEGGAMKLVLGATQKPYTFGAAKSDSSGCTPAIAWSGAASLSIGDNLRIGASGVPSGATGMLMWSYASANTPFHGGTKLVGSPLVRTAVQTASQGLVACGGTFDFHFSHALMSSHGVAAGLYVSAQYWYRDGGSIGLSDGLRIEIAE